MIQQESDFVLTEIILYHNETFLSTNNGNLISISKGNNKLL